MKKLLLFSVFFTFALMAVAQTHVTEDDSSPPKMEKKSLSNLGVETDKKGSTGIGIALGGGGLFGVPVRYFVDSKAAIELGAFYRPVLILDSYDELQTNGSIMLAGGVQLFSDPKVKESKGKINSNGLSLKVGHSFGTYAESFATIGWVIESSKKVNTNRSFIFELGGGVISRPWVDELEGTNKTGFLVYWKIHWNWFVGK